MHTVEIRAMQYMGKTAAVSSKHLEQINWTVPELPSSLPWKEARILLLACLLFLPRKTCTHTPGSSLLPRLPLT